MKPSIHWLYAFIPITLALDYVGGVSPALVFFCAAVAIVPISDLIVDATEQIATRTGDTVGSLLNATFGNAPNLIIAVVALKAGYVDMVRASIIGAILVNLLLALGLAFFLGGLKHREQQFNPASSRAYSTMMLLATISLAVPSAFSRLESEGTIPAEASLNTGVALALLVLYVLYLLYSLKTHSDLFASVQMDGPEVSEAPRWGLSRALGTLVGASVAAAWLSEILVGAAEGTGKALGMSEIFIGIILLAMVGGVAESGAALVMARKNKVDLSVGIALGGSIQIALFVAPVLVFASHLIGPTPLLLAFSRAEIWSLFLSALIGTVVCSDGQSNWFKGIQLIMLYVIIGLMFYFLPPL
jgi:Ca2+:H+ antiporter